MGFNLQETVGFVRGVVRNQGEVLVQRWSSAAPLHYKDRRDFATAADLEVEEKIKTALRARFPDHGLCGEETEGERRHAEYQWLIDPIDGTKYYAASSSLFAVSVGLLHRGEPILGVVYAAASSQCFYAWKGGGAFLDGNRLHGSPAEELSSVIANVETPDTHRLSVPERDWFEEKLLLLTRRLYRVRALGLGSLSACWLATGALDAYVDLTGYVKPQDLAAGRVIMKESGARLEILHPPDGPERLIAAPPKVCGALLEVLAEDVS